MERVGTLINKLKEQFDQQADTENLSITAQLLLAELQSNQKSAFLYCSTYSWTVLKS